MKLRAHKVRLYRRLFRDPGAFLITTLGIAYGVFMVFYWCLYNWPVV